jgi:RimJ/RimL family protein N-acetyltransferase/AcrR family transcriptional regulator
MVVDPRDAQRVLAATADLVAERSIASASRRAIARAAGVPLRVVREVGGSRLALLRQVVTVLPFPPVARHLQAQAEHPAEPALQALLRVAREALGDPAAAWDPVEIQALVTAPYDDELRAVVVARLEQRWAAALQVLEQLRGPGADPADADAAALHLIAVGLGLSVLAPLAPRWSDARAWTALSARLLEAIAVEDPAGGDDLAAWWRARVQTDATPAATARLLRVLSVLHVSVSSLFTAAGSEGEQQVDLLLRAPATVDRATLGHALASVGREVIVARGRPDDGLDIATRVLRLSALLAADPDAAPQGAADLVLADSWEVTDASSGPDASAHVLRLQWTVERHVVLRRSGAPFTRTEQNRASALLELVGALAEARGDWAGFGWRETLADGSMLVVRLARPEDAEGVAAMHERASPESRYQRYFTPMNEWREDNLRRISGGHRGATLVVTDETGEVIALGNVFPLGPDDADTAEFAVIVDDRWHRQGIGLLLTHRLVEVARRLGYLRLVAYVLAENRAMTTLLRQTGLTWTSRRDHDLGASVICLVADIAATPD